MKELIDNLVAEQDYLDAALAGVPHERWDVASPAEGWLLRDCIAHLADSDDLAAEIAATGEFPQREEPPGEGVRRGRQVEALAMSVDELTEWWRQARARLETALRPLDSKTRLPWAGRSLGVRSFTTARLMECWSHGLDALEAGGVEAVDSDRLRHVAHLGYATRDFAYLNRKMEPSAAPLRVELEAPSGARWTWGPEDAADRIVGTAGDFCRVVTQRIHYLDTELAAEGDAAREFLRVAQAFAGPPGAGRQPSGEH